MNINNEKYINERLVQDPLSQHLSWTKPPLYILVIKKLCNNLFDSFIDIIKYLIYVINHFFFNFNLYFLIKVKTFIFKESSFDCLC